MPQHFWSWIHLCLQALKLSWRRQRMIQTVGGFWYHFCSEKHDLQFPHSQRWNSLSLSWPCQVEGYSASRIGVGHYKLLLNLSAFVGISMMLMMRNLEFSRCEGPRLFKKHAPTWGSPRLRKRDHVAESDLPVSLKAQATCTRNTAIPIVMWWSQNHWAKMALLVAVYPRMVFRCSGPWHLYGNSSSRCRSAIPRLACWTCTRTSINSNIFYNDW